MAQKTKAKKMPRPVPRYPLPRGWHMLELVRTARDTWVALAYHIGNEQYAMVPFFGDSRRRGELIVFDPAFADEIEPALERFLDANYPEFDKRHGLVVSDDTDVPPHSGSGTLGAMGSAFPEALRGKLPRQNYSDDT